MLVKTSTVKKITISEIKNLDPISVYLEDFNIGQGKLIITCFDKSWSYYWGAMGTRNLKEFILSADNHYLSKKLAPTIPSDINDEDGLAEYAKKQIIQKRKELSLCKSTASELYYECDNLLFIKDEDYPRYSDLMYGIFGDEWYDCLPTKPNPDYEYFCRILDVVKMALKDIEKKNEAKN